jgi:MFS family permease
MQKAQASWIRLLVLFSAVSFIETAFFGQVAAFTPLYLPQLGVTPENIAVWTGGLMAASNFFGILFLPFWGALADRHSRKPIIVRSFVVHVAAIAIMLASGNIWVFLIGRSAMNLSLGNSGLMMVTLSERAPANRVGMAFAILHAWTNLGVFLGPLLGGRIVDRFSFETLLLINGVLMLAAIAALAFGYEDAFRGSKEKPLLRMAFESVTMILQTANLRSLFASFFVLFSGWMLTRTYLPLVVTALYTGRDPATIVGIVGAAAGLAALLVGPLAGALADRLGFWRVLFWGAVLEVALWPLPGFTWNVLSLAVAWTILNGVASGVFSISSAVLAATAPDQARGRVMSFAYLPLNAGLVAGPLLAAPLVSAYGVMAVFPFSALLTLAGAAMLARYGAGSIFNKAPASSSVSR